MMHRMLCFPSKWEWHELHEERPETTELRSRRHKQAPSSSSIIQLETTDDTVEALYKIKQTNPEMAGWLSSIKSSKQNYVVASELPSGEPVLYGTLIFQASENPHDLLTLDFWVTNAKVATIHTDYRLSIKLQMEPWQEKMNRCQTAHEAFFVLLSLILENLHIGLDTFETHLGELEYKMQRRNRTDLMNIIFERRYELLHWSHLFIPIREIMAAAKEAFLDDLTEQEEYKRMEFKLNRLDSLFTHYGMEIDTLLMMDDAISNFRGNDTMKTLTIFTALFTPATVIGSIWGMNFERIPWSSKPSGFMVMSLVILVTTLFIYIWLWRKGWTGDLLRGRKPHDIVSASLEPSPAQGRSADKEWSPRKLRSAVITEEKGKKSHRTRSRSSR